MAMPDPHTTTREVFTQALLSQLCPANAAPKYKKLYTDLQHLLNLLVHHPAMSVNLQQTYMTPAASKNKVYFMWDFVGRTLGMLNACDPQLKTRSRRMWKEVTGRCAFAEILIKDPGKLEMMNAAVGYNDDKGVDFGEEILRAAEALTELPK